MTDKSVPLDLDVEVKPTIKAQPRFVEHDADAARPRPVEGRRGLLATLDAPILIVTVMLLAIGGMMVYSTTFDWSFQEYGNDWTIFMGHARNLGIGLVFMALLTLIDYRVWKRLAVLLLLGTVGALIAVLIFSDLQWGARRSFLQGSYQPGELAELVVVVYMAAWMSSKNTKIQSITHGLIPFMILLGMIGGLVMLQPDLSTAATIFVVCGLMYFMAGANILHLGSVLAVMGAGGWVVSQRLSYAQDRVSSYVTSLFDFTQASYHTQQVMIAFINGGWFGSGLGQGRQKFGPLPAAHTDSIFAVIGEELGIVGATFVVVLFIVLCIRGFQIARRSTEPFGAMLAVGLTLWIITKAMLNIAVMLNLVPSTGIALPFISYGGSALVTVLAGIGLLLSVARVTARLNTPEGRGVNARYDRGWGNRWSRLPGAGDRGSR